MSRMSYGKKMQEKKLLKQLAVLFAAGGIYLAPQTVFAEETVDEYDLGEVVYTAERTPSLKEKTPTAVEVITREEIEANHYNDISEAIQNLNGVYITRAGSGNKEIARINGDERVVVLLDGKRLNDDQGTGIGRASADLRMLPSMKNIERIEVVRGGASSLYGSDAVGGVINIITRKAKETVTTVDLSTGSWGSRKYELTTEGSKDDFSWLLSVGKQQRDHYAYNYKGKSYDMTNSESDNNSFYLRLDKKLNEDNSLQFDFLHRSLFYGQALYDNMTDSFVKSDNESLLYNNWSLAYNFKEQQANPGFVRIFDNYKSSNFSGHFSSRLRGIDYQNGWKVGDKQNLIAGFEWHESDSENKAAGYDGKKMTNTALYLQDTVALDEKWTVIPSARLDSHSEYGSHLTPKLALNYQADKKTQLFADWGRVFKAPNADDLFYRNDAYGGTYGNPNLNAESGHKENLGIRHQFDKNTSLEASLFWSTIHDAIYWVSDPLTWRTTAENIALEKKHGIDISFKQRLDDNWSYNLGYTYTHMKADYNSSSALEEKNPAPNSYFIGLQYNGGNWQSNLRLRNTSGLNEKYYLAGNVTLLDWNTSYQVNQQTNIYFKAENLTDQEYSAYPGSEWSRYPGSGRYFEIGVSYSF